MPGKIILLPNVLDEALSHESVFPPSVALAVKEIQGLIVESEKSGRRYLRRFLSHEKMAALALRLLNEHTQTQEFDHLLEPMKRGEVWGLISDAGLPCIADPGAELVARAHRLGIEVEALVGPCSIILALQLSGFSGQCFCFHGYLPKEESLLEQAFRNMEKRCKIETQIWIEAPYRSEKMLDQLKRVLSLDTVLCVAASLTFPTQKVLSQPIRLWKQSSFSLSKEPAIFLLGTV